MAKRHVLVDTPSSKKRKVARDTNWELCVLCQEDTGAVLQCPVNSRRAPIGSGYASLAANLTKFFELGHTPMNIDIARLNDGGGIEATLMRHNARWHKACRLKVNKTKLDRLEHSVKSKNVEISPLAVTMRSRHDHVDLTEAVCFLCNQPAGSDALHRACTRDIDVKVRKCAIELEDTDLLSKLAPGDMVALEAKYHKKCLANLYNRARAATESTADTGIDARLKGFAFAELVAFMEDAHAEESIIPTFKLSDLAGMYRARLEQLGVSVSGRIHTSRLKTRLLAVLPDLQAHSQGRDVLLTFDVGSAIKKACDHDSDAMHLALAAQVVRREMFDQEFHFDGSFKQGCQHDSVPKSLMALLNMILKGPNIEHQSRIGTESTTAALSISQLVMFNRVKAVRAAGSTYHSHARETPLPIYIALKIHAVTRSRNLIDTLFNLGMSVSYDRLLQLTSDIGNGVIERFEKDGVVCPPKMRKGVFTSSAVDNVDYNPTSATAKDALHGTGISLIQHPTDPSEGCDRGVVIINQSSSSTKSIAPLPTSYTNIPPAALKSKEFTVPSVQGLVKPADSTTFTHAKKDELGWLNKVMDALQKEHLDEMEWVSWSAYHADIQSAVIPSAAINALLPLFLENAHSVAMIKHSMTIVRAAIQHLNPGQVPVLAADQPLYALAKQIQWTWPSTFGEDQFVMMFGGLHIEMATLKVLGDWLEGSGWASALVQANIASTGTADSFTKASHVTKTRHAHQVTAACLHTLLHRAYTEYTFEASSAEMDVLSVEMWSEVRAQESVQFSYWLKTLSLEITLLLFIRSLREGNFQLYMESLTQMVPWLFALDHTHYSRWLPVHIRDMTQLSEKHPAIMAEFEAGKFTVHKTRNKFSAMAIDQCHEQNNAIVKQCGGAVGLTTNPGALRRWMVAGPEVSRIVAEFETCAQGIRADSSDYRHHEQHAGVQATFISEVGSLIMVIEEMGNPFQEKSNDLLVLDTRNIVDTSVGETVHIVEALGMEQYNTFIKERLTECIVPITDMLPKNKLALFRTPPSKLPSKQKMQVSALKSDCNLFSRLYIACQTRDGDLATFFMHKNQITPPSLSVGGSIRLGTKADLLRCLQLEEYQETNSPAVDAKFFDGAAVVQMLHPGTAKTFQDYANAFASYISSQLETAQRVDIVWDVYVTDSLKSVTRQKRGKGVRRRVAPATAIPKNWKDFLRVDENKSELFGFLSQHIKSLPTEEGKCIYTTHGSDVLSSMVDDDMINLVPCSHEEADTRLLLHVADAIQKGFRKICVRTVDTDVVVLAIAMFPRISPEELWIAFGTGSNFHYIPVHEVAAAMDPRVCATLHVFHAFTGCDTTSSFGGRGKKTAWNTWNVFSEVTMAFEDLLLMQSSISSSTMSALERFVILMYDRTSDINEARKQLFAQKSRSMENLPPTLAALEQHIKRVCYQSNCWNQALIPDPDLPSPADWGWKKEAAGWEPLWTMLPEASQSCSELIRCGCKRGCTGRCKCFKAALKCTALCYCSGDCQL